MKHVFIKLGVCIIVYTLLALPVLPVIASDISDADFYGVIQTTNNSTATTAVSSNVSGLNSSELIAAGYLNSSANNCAIRNSSGADIRFMPGYGSSPWVMFFGSLGANSITNSIAYFKNVTGGAIRYFPGSTGMNVTDAAGLEIGSNGAISFTDAFISPSQSGSIFTKSGAITASTGNGSISVSIPGLSYPVITSNVTGFNGAQSGIGVTMPASIESGDLLIAVLNAFGGGAAPVINTPSGWVQLDYLNNFTGGNVATYGLYYKVATGTETTTNFTTNIVNSNAYQVLNIDKDSYSGIPTVGVRATGNNANPDPPVNTGYGTNATMYMAVSASFGQNHTAAPASYVGLLNILSGGLSSGIGTAERYISAGSQNPGTFTLSGATQWVTNTIALKGAGGFTYATSDGEKSNLTVSVNATSGDLELWINGVNVANTSLGGSAVPNNANPYLFGSSTSTLYIGEITVTVAGVTKGQWEWEYDTTFTDLSGNGNTGTPSFRTTSSDADVTSVLVSFQPISEPIAPAFAVGTGPDFFDTSNVTSGNFTTGNVTLDYPLKELIEDVAAAGGVPYQIPSTFISSFVLIALSMLTSFFLKRYSAQSIFLKTIVNTGAYGVLIALHIYDWWMLIFFFIFEASIWFAAQHRRE